MSLNSKRLVEAAMRLRAPHNQFKGTLHPKYVQKLIKVTEAPKPLLYKLHQRPENLSMLYPHPEPLKTLEQLPFFVERTTTGNLPVYVEYNCNHNIKRTVIRRITGDVDNFCQQLQKVISNFQIRKKVGTVQIPGVHKQSVFHWLIRLGF